MHRCLSLARLAAGDVAPNPMVGAVMVFEDKIIGEGYHKQYGMAHAEVNCIDDVAAGYRLSGLRNEKEIDEILEKSCLYVSLEPCAHFGKTPPCADLIIRKRIPKVIIGCRDPFTLVDGRGIEKLKSAGVEVITDVLIDECRALNKRFFTFHSLQRPYIILKWAQTADVKIAANDSSRLLITNEFTNRKVHQWRSEEASIMVGTNTALLDNPSLNTRFWPGNNPVRIVPDMKLRLPHSLHIFNGQAKTIIFNSRRHEEKGGVVYHRIKGDMPLVNEITSALYKLNVQSVLVEGGTRLLQSFIDAQTWDEARVITNTRMEIRNGPGAPRLPETVLLEEYNIHQDNIRIFQPFTENSQATS